MEISSSNPILTSYTDLSLCTLSYISIQDKGFGWDIVKKSYTNHSEGAVRARVLVLTDSPVEKEMAIVAANEIAIRNGLIFVPENKGVISVMFLDGGFSPVVFEQGRVKVRGESIICLQEAIRKAKVEADLRDIPYIEF